MLIDDYLSRAGAYNIFPDVEARAGIDGCQLNCVLQCPPGVISHLARFVGPSDENQLARLTERCVRWGATKGHAPDWGCQVEMYLALIAFEPFAVSEDDRQPETVSHSWALGARAKCLAALPRQLQVRCQPRRHAS